MARRWIVLASAGLALLGSAPASARAGTLECMWSNIPAALRDSLYAAYDRDGLAGLNGGGIDNSRIERIHDACVARRTRASTAQLRATGNVLVGITLAKSAARRLSQSDPRAPSRLTHVWRTLSEPDRQQLRSAFLVADDNDTAAAKGVLAKAVAMATADSPSARPAKTAANGRDYVNFFLGMAQAEAFLDQI